MKAFFSILLSLFACASYAKTDTYVGSTPANIVVRDFLGISSTDSIDFIRWKLEIGTDGYRLDAEYGRASAGSPGFIDRKQVAFDGQLTHSGNRYTLSHAGKVISILELNANVLHLLGPGNNLLIGNGGYSYSLNNVQPVRTDAFNIPSVQTAAGNPLVFEGRTPCQELSALLGLNKGPACNKMKWYFLLYQDSLTGKPSYFLMGGIAYKIETMTRGSWQVETGPNGKAVYRLYCDTWSRPLRLLKGDDNTLFFTGADERMLVGNQDFSYTLNRRKEPYPRIER
ncbi:MAG: hypothetical protein JO301_05790 [Chitinophagaceae bacterium]|nr:hypothetical protein [Chitinophagaceae bacterium]